MDKIRAGVVGVGLMGRLYGRLLKELPQAELTAVYDVDAERAAEVGAELGTKAFASVEALLSQVDAVFICSPDRAHLEPVLAAAAAGKHVFVEKPLATSSEEGLQMVEAAEEAGIVFMVGHVLRFDPRYIHARNAVAAGDVGEVIHMFARRNTYIDQGRHYASWTTVPWFLGIHDIDALMWICGSPIISVYARGARKLLAKADDSVLAVLTFANGAIAGLEVSFVLPLVQGNRQSPLLEVVGSKGMIHVMPYLRGITIHKPDGLVGVYKDETVHFLRCIQEGITPAVTGRDALLAVTVVEALERSLASGQEEKVESITA
jgi:predicted dehydrogenase